jgi:hypothetical protein
MPATDLFAKIVLKRFSQNLLGNVFRNHGSHFRDLSLTKRLVDWKERPYYKGRDQKAGSNFSSFSAALYSGLATQLGLFGLTGRRGSLLCFEKRRSYSWMEGKAVRDIHDPLYWVNRNFHV